MTYHRSVKAFVVIQQLFHSIFIRRILNFFVGCSRAVLFENYIYHYGFRTPGIRWFLERAEIDPAIGEKWHFDWSNKFARKLGGWTKEEVERKMARKAAQSKSTTFFTLWR